MSAAVVVFAKNPVPGRVKTRLTPVLSPEEAANAYEAALKDVLTRVAQSSATVLVAYDDAEGARDYFASMFPGLRAIPQTQGDLGTRMAAACDRLLEEGHESVVVIGTDSPTLPIERIEDAVDALGPADVVFGPAEDGGYYLVGVARAAWPAASAIFSGIAWSTPSVLDQSLERAARAKLRTHLLPTWYDIDEPADLDRAGGEATAESHFGRWYHDWRRRRPPGAP